MARPRPPPNFLPVSEAPQHPHDPSDRHALLERSADRPDEAVDGAPLTRGRFVDEDLDDPPERRPVDPDDDLVATGDRDGPEDAGEVAEGTHYLTRAARFSAARHARHLFR